MFPLSRRCLLLILLLPLVARAEVEEIFSRHLRIFQPRGEFAANLIRVAPAAGAGWKLVGGEKLGFRCTVPADAEVNEAVEGNRILSVKLASPVVAPRPVLQIHRYNPQPGDPSRIDRDYAQAYAEQYGESAFKGKFTLTDSGLVTRDRKTSFAMVGGTYRVGATGAYRVQWAYLDEGMQLFATFDCSDQDWPRYSEPVGRMLLSIAIERPKKK